MAKIVLNHQMTGGYNADGPMGDEGIMVVIEPRSAQGRLITLAGEISIALVDPSLAGPKARVGRWDFKRDQVERLLRKAQPGAGIQIELPWQNHPPEHERLMLFVRFTTADGQRHEASQPILIDLPGGDEGGAIAPHDQARGDTARRKWAPDR